MILPGATLGMLGGGQLGRMFTVAAQTLGYKVIVLDPSANSPAGTIAHQHLCADYTDQAALIQLAQSCQAITTEFENIPADSLAFLAQYTRVHPSADALKTTQHRAIEKQFIQQLGIPTAPFIAINSTADCENIHTQITFPAILKSATFGYDGKGQIRCANQQELLAAFQQLDQQACILEQQISLAKEVSVVLARGQSGDICHFPIAENHHINGILHSSTVPSSINQHQTEKVFAYADDIANALDYVGTLAVEFFISDSGDIMVNEIAPRPHNSGHYSLDACHTSQFEQQVRMLCDLPPGDSTLISPAVMINLLGDLWPDDQQPDWSCLLSQSNHKLHLYDKTAARPGRKMGHFTVLADKPEKAIAIANATFDQLKQS